MSGHCRTMEKDEWGPSSEQPRAHPYNNGKGVSFNMLDEGFCHYNHIPIRFHKLRQY